MDERVRAGLAVYPKTQFHGGAALFNERYLADFSARNPFVALSPSPYYELLRKFPNDPAVRACQLERVEHHRAFRAQREEWARQWPEAAAHLQNERNRWVNDRNARKKSNLKASIAFEKENIARFERILSRPMRQTNRRERVHRELEASRKRVQYWENKLRI